MYPKSKSCCICEEIASGRLSDEFQRKSKLNKRVFCESSNLVAVPSISPLTPGHVLIIPKYHVTSIMQIQQTQVPELEDFITRILELVRVSFGQAIIFEHGVGRGKRGGCGVSHAHLHILPVRANIARRILSIVAQDFCLTKPKSLASLIRKGSNGKSYLLYGRNQKEVFLAYDENIPSQYLRKIIAMEIGHPSWDWKELFGWEHFSRSYELLSTGIIDY